MWLKIKLLSVATILGAVVSLGVLEANAQEGRVERDQPVTAATTTRDDGFDWGWVGLAGLIGLVGLMPRDRTVRNDSSVRHESTGRHGTTT